MSKIKKIIISLIPLAVGGLSALLSGDMSTDGFNNAPLTPPEWVFPVVWTILYLMIGIASMLYITMSCEPRGSLGYFYFGLALNFSWSILFFRFNLFWACVAVLLVMIAVSTVSAVGFYKSSRLAGYLMVPYIAWLLFALYLNVWIAVMN